MKSNGQKIQTLQSSLTIKDLEVAVSLGWTAQERKTPQLIALTLHINFAELPAAAYSDQLNDTICYDTLCQHATAFCQSKSFQLIEHLGYALHQHLKTQLNISELSITLHKLAPPIANLKGGAVFNINEGNTQC